MKLALILLAAGVCAGAQEMSFTVALNDPLSTHSSHKGDPVTARVLQPAPFEGDIIQGKVTESKAGNKLHGQAVLNFNFDTLIHSGQSVPIACSIASIENSKGQANVDEEGRVIRKSSNVGKALGGAGLGGLIGGIAGGAKGAAIGAAAGGAAAIILIEVAAQGPAVDFAPGARFELFVKSRGGPQLSSLPPNHAATAAAAAPAAPVSEPMPVSVPASAPVAAAAGPAGNAAPAAGAQPDLTTVKIDFVPGEKTLFFDNFSDMAPDEPPPHWKVRGGTVELRMGGGIRQLTIPKPPDTRLTSGPIPFTKNFTFETEMLNQCAVHWRFEDKGGNEVFRVQLAPPPAAGEQRAMEVNIGDLGQASPTLTGGQPIHVALWMQEGRVRVYFNDTRIIDVNQVTFDKPIDHLALWWPNWGGCNGSNGVRSVRVAESAPDAATVLSTTGKYVTHGIHFDTDSDRLKVDSAPIMKQIAAALIKNPNLKLEIDGYTDSTGDAEHNLDLSKRRAEAVETVLVSQYGIEASRLNSNGFGADKPIASNDTPGGRAQNRRVEFVKK